jgi:hypothetical protein
MFVVSLDVSGPVAMLGAMLREINHFGRVGIGQELSAWQVDDMHRGRPFTLRNRSQKTARTLVRPHSRYEVNRSRKTQRAIVRRVRRKGELLTLPTQPKRPWSTRPILRQTLIDRLHERMSYAMRDKIRWPKPR